jgi:uncharacterized membrane protein HdeD (DUF308 family)
MTSRSTEERLRARGVSAHHPRGVSTAHPPARNARSMSASVAAPTPLDPEASAGKYWWLPLAAGVLTTLIGFVALLYPGPTLLAIGIIIGAYLIAWGVMTTVRGIAGERGLSTVMRIVHVVLGLLTLLAGLIVLVRPGESLVTVALVLGFWLVLVGALQLMSGIVESEGRVWNIALGLVGIVAGVIILAQPGIGLGTLVWIVSLGLLLRGAVEIGAGLRIRELHKQGAL